MRVLHLTTEFPWPARSGGPVRTLSQLGILASLPEIAHVTVTSLAEEPLDATRLAGLEAALPKVRAAPPVFHPIHLWDFPAYVPRVLALRALGVPYLAGKFDSPRVRALVRAELVGLAPDVVYLDHLAMAQYLEDARELAPRARVVLDQHNLESEFFDQYAKRQRGPKRVAARLEADQAARYERRVLRAVDAVVAISPDDAAHFRRLSGVEPHVVPQVVAFTRRTRAAAEGRRFCYVGNLRWHPNVAGLDWLCAEVWPKVRASAPDAELEIAGIGLPTGPDGAPIVPDAWKVPGVRTLGFLDDLEPLYARAQAMVAPVFGGSGVRMKLLEGMRAGMPIVTTKDSAHGLPLESGRELLVADDAAAFADAMLRLLGDPALGQRLQEGSYAYLERHHSLAAAQGVMRRALGT